MVGFDTSYRLLLEKEKLVQLEPEGVFSVTAKKKKKC